MRRLADIEAELDAARRAVGSGIEGSVKPKLSPEAVHLLHANRHERRRLKAIDRRIGERKVK